MRQNLNNEICYHAVRKKKKKTCTKANIKGVHEVLLSSDLRNGTEKLEKQDPLVWKGSVSLRKVRKWLPSQADSAKFQK